MADYAIGLSFHKAHRTLVRVIPLTPPCRLFATRSANRWVTLPTLEPGMAYTEMQVVKQGSFQISDNDNNFRLLGDDGWNDSVITGSGVKVSMTSMFAKDTVLPAGGVCPEFRGGYEEGFSIIERARGDKNYEIYIEFLKELGPINGDEGDWVYDYTGFNAVMSNYQEGLNAESLTEVSFDLTSRGRPTFGLYNAGPVALKFGSVQAGLLSTSTVDGDRRYAVSPANNASSVSLSSSVTITYTDAASDPLEELSLSNPAGAGFYIINPVTGNIIPSVVTLVDNVVTINPVDAFEASNIYFVSVEDGAIRQSVDGLGDAAPDGVLRPLQGFSSTFRTA